MLNLRTYYVTNNISRLTAYLVAYEYPFTYDGTGITFHALPSIIDKITLMDKILTNNLFKDATEEERD